MNVRTEIAYGMATDGCTAISWKTEKSSFLAQNWDWQEEQQENIIALKIDQDRAPSIGTITEAGIIGKIGLNSSGVGVCLNAIRASGVDFKKLPCHLALRTCLESSSAKVAVLNMQRIGVASACHILVADSIGGTGLECSCIDTVELPMDSHGVVTHTNHFLKPHPGIEDKVALPDSRPRLHRINELVLDKLVEYTERTELHSPDIARLLRDEKNLPAAICRSRTSDSSIATLFSIVMDLDQGRAEVVIGRPSQSKAEIFTLIPEAFTASI